MPVSGNSVNAKGFQSFQVSEGLLQKVTEAVEKGEKQARSSGDVKSFEVFYHGFRQNISIGRIFIVPASVCNKPDEFPISLLYGTVVKLLNLGEETADLIAIHTGSEFDEEEDVKEHLTSFKEKAFTVDGKEVSLIVFAPAWSGIREYVAFQFVDDTAKLNNLLRHLVFSCYFNPAVSSGFNALMTTVDTWKLDVTDMTPKLTYPALTESPLKKYPELLKTASVRKRIFLTAKTADAIAKNELEPEEMDVFKALGEAVGEALGHDTTTPAEVADKDYKTPAAGAEVPRADDGTGPKAASATPIKKRGDAFAPKSMPSTPMTEEEMLAQQQYADIMSEGTKTIGEDELEWTPEYRARVHGTEPSKVGPAPRFSSKKAAVVPPAAEPADSYVVKEDGQIKHGPCSMDECLNWIMEEHSAKFGLVAPKHLEIEEAGQESFGPKPITAAFRKRASIDPFLASYIETALWSSNDNSNEQGGEPLDKNYSLLDIAPETLKLMQQDCDTFRTENAQLLQQAIEQDGASWGQIAHDFWLTRNRHGAGFWDGDYPATGDKLTQVAHAFGESDLLVDEEDGRLYLYEDNYHPPNLVTGEDIMNTPGGIKASRKQADTADNPANQTKDGEGAMDPKTGKDKPVTAAMKKVSYVVHCPGHKNSKGESAEWCIKSHETGKILSSHGSEEAAKSHLQDMHAHSGATKTAEWVLTIKDQSGRGYGFVEKFQTEDAARQFLYKRALTSLLDSFGIQSGTEVVEQMVENNDVPAILNEFGEENPEFKELVEQEDWDGIIEAYYQGEPETYTLQEDFRTPRKPKAPKPQVPGVQPPKLSYKVHDADCTCGFCEKKGDIAGKGKKDDKDKKEASVKVAGLEDTIKAGDRVTINVQMGAPYRDGHTEYREMTGRAVMRGPAGWVLNMGGKHGTPATANDENIVKVRRRKTADTADNPANEKGGKDIIHPKTDAEKPNTRGETPEMAPEGKTGSGPNAGAVGTSNTQVNRIRQALNALGMDLQKAQMSRASVEELTRINDQYTDLLERLAAIEKKLPPAPAFAAAPQSVTAGAYWSPELGARPPMSMNEMFSTTNRLSAKEQGGVDFSNGHRNHANLKTADAQMHCPQCQGTAHKASPSEAQYSCPSCGWKSAQPLHTMSEGDRTQELKTQQERQGFRPHRGSKTAADEHWKAQQALQAVSDFFDTNTEEELPKNEILYAIQVLEGVRDPSLESAKLDLERASGMEEFGSAIEWVENAEKKLKRYLGAVEGEAPMNNADVVADAIAEPLDRGEIVSSLKSRKASKLHEADLRKKRSSVAQEFGDIFADILPHYSKQAAGQLWKAWVDTRNFSFEGYGTTREEAVVSLQKAFIIHAKQYQAPSNWWKGSVESDIQTREIGLGVGYRDGEPLQLPKAGSYNIKKKSDQSVEPDVAEAKAAISGKSKKELANTPEATNTTDAADLEKQKSSPDAGGVPRLSSKKKKGDHDVQPDISAAREKLDHGAKSQLADNPDAVKTEDASKFAGKRADQSVEPDVAQAKAAIEGQSKAELADNPDAVKTTDIRELEKQACAALGDEQDEAIDIGALIGELADLGANLPNISGGEADAPQVGEGGLNNLPAKKED